MNTTPPAPHTPMILAPAGSRQSFLAALAAGADGIYCGLKTFSARMAAINFTMDELVSLGDMARHQGSKLFIALNTLLKPGEPQQAASVVNELVGKVRPDAMIIQDLGFIPLIRQAGFDGEVHLSTLANVTFSRALSMVRGKLGVDQVVIPRELDIDEIKQLADNCPSDLGLEMFIHGALCYGVSGRCYWSSFLGGKSGLRGRCVQPCRRIYSQEKDRAKFFSCLDFSVDVLAKVLLEIPQVRTWKIEGRKKGPHYVYYTVSAYQMLRDHGRDPQAKRDAVALLERALGRPGTHYNFLPQRPQNPIRTDVQTGSGLMVGRVKGGGRKAWLAPREALLAGDVLRIGYEDESWHGVQRVGRYVPKHGRLYLKPPKGRGPGPDVGTPVFLVDRMEQALKEKIGDFGGAVDRKSDGRGTMDEGRKSKAISSNGPFRPPSESRRSLREASSPGFRQRKKRQESKKPSDLTVFRRLVKKRGPGMAGYWLSEETVAAAAGDRSGRISWWLPPVIWPKEEDAWAALVSKAVDSGGRMFVLNAPWQMSFFQGKKQCRLWAGPFCNTANSLALSVLKELGFTGVMVSPELGEKEILVLPGESPLPLGVVVSGFFPLSISRVLSGDLKQETLFTSPKGEGGWAKQYGSDYWIFPNWRFDLAEKRPVLEAAGYELFISMSEPVPRGVDLKKRPGIWNWKVGLQ